MADPNKYDITCLEGTSDAAISGHELFAKHVIVQTIATGRTSRESNNTRPYKNSLPRATTDSKAAQTC